MANTSRTVYKKTSLPAVLLANSFYCIPSVANPDFFEFYLTNADGTAAKRIPTTSDIQSMIGTALSGFTTIEVVDNIAARDALAPIKPIFALVLDATADATVNTGSASYIYDSTASEWKKVSEYESLDLVLTWESIKGRPTSSVADIDAAVAQRHTHSNKAQLDKIGEDADGRITYAGMDTVVTFASPEW